MLSQNERQDLTRATIRGTVWSYAAKYSGKFLVFISTLILARLLSQEDFGVAGYALTVISFIEVMNGLGIVPALIFYDLVEERTDTAFWLGLLVGIGLGVLTWMIGPLAGDFFRDERAVGVTRLLALTFPIQGAGLVQDALLRKDLKFGRRFVPEMGRSIAKGGVSIVLAFMGFSYWSLLWGQLAGFVVNTILMWWAVPWRPSLRFVTRYVRPMLSYGTHMVVVNILGILLLNTDYLLVGRFLGAAALGIYTLAFRVPDLLINQFCVTIAQVVFPAYAKMKDDIEGLRHSSLQTMRYVALATVPMGLGMAILARPFVLVAFGWKWEEAIPIVPWIVAYTVLRSFGFNLGDVFKAQGRPEILTWLSVVQVMLMTPAIYWAVTVPQTLVAVGWVVTAISFIGMVLNFAIAARMLQTPLTHMFRALQPALISGVVMGTAVALTYTLVLNLAPIWQLVIVVPVGMLVYTAALWFTERDLLHQIWRTLSKSLGRKPLATNP